MQEFPVEKFVIQQTFCSNHLHEYHAGQVYNNMFMIYIPNVKYLAPTVNCLLPLSKQFNLEFMQLKYCCISFYKESCNFLEKLFLSLQDPILSGASVASTLQICAPVRVLY
jgi:hypothetical protein